jgi:folate-binding protein YgfZ
MSTTELHERAASASHSETASDFGDVRAEFENLISGCGIYDLARHAQIKLAGRDRIRWLNGMVSNNIRDLEAGRGVYAFVLNAQGHILGDLCAYNTGEFLLVDTDRTQIDKLLSLFRKYVIMDKVEIEDFSGKRSSIGIAGPRCRDVLEAAGFQAPELQALQFVEMTWQQVRVTLVRGDNPLVESYELWAAPEHSKNLWQSLVLGGGTPAGTAAVELLRIAAGIPRYGQDIRERDLPQETEQSRALNFTKGCYIGQEIVERIRSRGGVHRKFVGFEIEGPLPPPGTKVQLDDKEVGEITSAALLPLEAGERKVALGYCRREVASSRREVTIGAGNLRISELPFSEITAAC